MALQTRKVLITRLLKNKDARPDVVSGYHPVEDKFCFMNGYEAVFMKENFGYEIAKPPMVEKNLTELMYKHLPKGTTSMGDAGHWSGMDCVEINLADLEEFINHRGGRRHIDPSLCYQVSNGRYYDPILLYDMVHLIPREAIYICGKAYAYSLRDNNSWLWFYNSEGESGVLLPKNPRAKY